MQLILFAIKSVCYTDSSQNGLTSDLPSHESKSLTVLAFVKLEEPEVSVWNPLMYSTEREKRE